jgi:hypothetical protein
MYVVVQFTLVDGTVFYKLLCKEEDEVGKLCLPMNEIFGSIKDAHVSKKNIPTSHSCSANKFSGYVLSKVNRILLKTKRGRKTIFSGQFCNRFQVDIIDMRTKPATNVYDITLRCTVTVKDHLTSFFVGIAFLINFLI